MNVHPVGSAQKVSGMQWCTNTTATDTADTKESLSKKKASHPFSLILSVGSGCFHSWHLVKKETKSIIIESLYGVCGMLQSHFGNPIIVIHSQHCVRGVSKGNSWLLKSCRLQHSVGMYDVQH